MENWLCLPDASIPGKGETLLFSRGQQPSSGGETGAHLASQSGASAWPEADCCLSFSAAPAVRYRDMYLSSDQPEKSAGVSEQALWTERKRGAEVRLPPSLAPVPATWPG